MDKIVSMCILGLAACIGILTYFGPHGIREVKSLEGQERILRQKNRSLQRDILHLKNNLYGVENDSHSLESKVRTELGMAKPGEVIYVISQEK